MTQTTDLLTIALTGALPFILIVAAVLTLPAALGLLGLYRRAVVRSMRARSASNAAPSETLPPAFSSSGQSALGSPAAHTASFLEASAQALYARLRRAPLFSATVYAIAGSAYALVMAAAYLLATQTDFSVLRFLTLFWIYVWPVVLAVNIVAVTKEATRVALTLFYFLLFALFGAFALLQSESLSVDQLATLWLILNFLPTSLLLTFLTRRVRAVGRLVFTFMVLTVTGSILVLSGAGGSDLLLHAIVTIGDAFGLGAIGVFVVLTVLGFGVFGLLGWLTLRWIRTRYERKQLSDQSLTLDAVWLLFSVVYSINFAFEGPWWIGVGLVAFAIYKGIGVLGFSLLGLRAAARQRGRTLLLLRVFSLGKRSEQLFANLTTYWRYGGSVRFIAGPDLLTATVEPHEFLDFVSGKLARRFIDGLEAFRVRIAEEDLTPDQDGRFRVNDFFCRDEAWRMVLARLAPDSDVVLMDLRGFSSKNDGCVFEIRELVKIIRIERVAFVIDETTDEQLFQQTIRQAWEQLPANSLNSSTPLERLQPFRFEETRRGELLRLLLSLCRAATVA